MGLDGKICLCAVIILSIAPFSTNGIDHNVTQPAVTNGTSTKVKTHESSAQPTVVINGTVTPSKPKTVVLHSSPHHQLANDTTQPTHKNVTAKPVARQMMEGGGTFHDLDSKVEITKKPVKVNLTASVPEIPKSSLEPHKNISPRKGAPVETQTDVQLPVSSTTTLRPHKKKPEFTMIKGDKFSQDSESFIESPTTGKDYVLPLVLVIFAVPGFVFLVKFLYKRGTEFTERQQYHRMYLIDGDYRAHFLERWGRIVKNILGSDTSQTTNLTKFEDMGLNPRMNYHSF